MSGRSSRARGRSRVSCAGVYNQTCSRATSPPFPCRTCSSGSTRGAARACWRSTRGRGALLDPGARPADRGGLAPERCPGGHEPGRLDAGGGAGGAVAGVLRRQDRGPLPDAARGASRWSTSAAGFDDGVTLDLGLGQMILEGLRRLDEWPDLDRRYPSESALLCADGAAGRAARGLRAMLEAARRRASIARDPPRARPLAPRGPPPDRGAARAGLRPRRGGGGEGRPRLVAGHQAQALVVERQFEEAAIVFRSLLQADPSDRRVRNLLREAERDQVAALYEELSPVAVPVLLGGDRLPGLPGGAPAHLHRPRGGGAHQRRAGTWRQIALACPLREVETLKVDPQAAAAGAGRPRRPQVMVP